MVKTEYLFWATWTSRKHDRDYFFFNLEYGWVVFYEKELLMDKEKVLKIQGTAIQTKIEGYKREIAKLNHQIKREEANLAAIVFQLQEIKGNSSDDEK